jgi:hypothetical protein
VSKYFAEVFEKLVPAGKGSLKMQKRIDQDEDVGHLRTPVICRADVTLFQEPMPSAEDRERTKIDSYTGVSIEVSWNVYVDRGPRLNVVVPIGLLQLQGQGRAADTAALWRSEVARGSRHRWV